MDTHTDAQFTGSSYTELLTHSLYTHSHACTHMYTERWRDMVSMYKPQPHCAQVSGHFGDYMPGIKADTQAKCGDLNGYPEFQR